MPDPGTRRSIQDGSQSSDGLRMLRRIADVLDMPVSDFYRCDPIGSEAATPSAAECELMLMAFMRVRDAEARARIIDMMRSCSGN